MATIEELERQAAEIAEAEGEVLRGLIENLREAAVSLPDRSRLAIWFAETAKVIEGLAFSREAQAIDLNNRFHRLAAEEKGGI